MIRGHAQLKGCCLRAPSLSRQSGSRVRFATARAEETSEKAAAKTDVEIQNDESEAAQKAKRVAELRAQEQWMKVGTGEADCISCGFKYDPKKGDPEYPVNPNTRFQELPGDWNCPVCGAEKRTFQVQETEIAGFAVNQGYGFGTNSMTEGQKSGLIYGSLTLFFFLFLCGYFLQ